MPESDSELYPLGFLQSPLKEPGEAPRQGREGAPDAWLEVHASIAEALEALAVSDEIIVMTWLHQAGRDILNVHPRGDETVPLAGVFATRSPDRPNPLVLIFRAIKRAVQMPEQSIPDRCGNEAVHPCSQCLAILPPS